MNFFDLMGLISTIALTLPVILLIVCRLSFYKSFPALLVYYTCLLAHNIITFDYLETPREVIRYVGIAANLLDAPLMLLFMTYFSPTASFRKKLINGTYIFLAYELAVIVLFGFTIKAITIILAPGILIVMALAGYFFVHQVKLAVVYQKAVGKAIMITSLLAAYAGYAFVYTVYYLIQTPYKSDAQLIVFMVHVITSIPLAVGIFFERKRVGQLEELKVTRQELKTIYNDEAPSQGRTSLDAIIFKMDNDRWKR